MVEVVDYQIDPATAQEKQNMEIGSASHQTQHNNKFRESSRSNMSRLWSRAHHFEQNIVDPAKTQKQFVVNGFL